MVATPAKKLLGGNEEVYGGWGVIFFCAVLLFVWTTETFCAFEKTRQPVNKNTNSSCLSLVLIKEFKWMNRYGSFRDGIKKVQEVLLSSKYKVTLKNWLGFFLNHRDTETQWPTVYTSWSFVPSCLRGSNHRVTLCHRASVVQIRFVIECYRLAAIFLVRSTTRFE